MGHSGSTMRIVLAKLFLPSRLLSDMKWKNNKSIVVKRVSRAEWSN